MRTTPTRLSFAMAATAAILALPTGVAAALAAGDPFAGLDRIDHAEMADLRGGMMVGGIQMDFAVVIRTTVQGAGSPAGLETTLVVNDIGQLGNSITRAVGGAMAQSLPGGAVTMVTEGGGTSITHQVTKDQVAALIANTASSRNILSSTEVNVTAPGFNTMAQGFSARTHAARMGYDSSLVGLGRM